MNKTQVKCVSAQSLQSNGKWCFKDNATAPKRHKISIQNVCLDFSVDELQVNWGPGAEQAMCFGLDVSRERRHANVELLDDLPKE